MLFSQVIGQQELKNHLIDEVQNGKISHAQLFLGNPGYGILPLTLAFVQYLFCEDKQKNDSCGKCNACRKVDSLQHPDLHFSFPSVQALSKTSDGLLGYWREQIKETPYFNLNKWVKRIDPKERKPIIGKDESQEIIKKLSLRSYEGGFKVLVMWMAEEMNTTCANKLLKMIEEPPERTLIILIATSQEKLLQTILSRTQKVVIPRVETEELSAFLRNEKGLNQEGADSVVARSDGDVIEALELIGDHVEHDENYHQFTQLMRVCYKKNVLEMIQWSEDIASTSKEHQKVFLRYALHMFRQSILKNYTEDQLTRTSEEEDKFLNNFSRFITGNNIMEFTKLFDDSFYQIDRNANGKILFTNLCFKVMRHIHTA